MQGLMQNRPLLISTLIEYAAAWHGDREIVSRDPEGSMHRTTYSALQPRAKRLASALHSLGVGFGVPVATLAWNSFRRRIASWTRPFRSAGSRSAIPTSWRWATR